MTLGPPPGRGGPQKIPRPPGTRLGDPPPWVDLDPRRRRLSLDDVRAALDQSPPARPSPVELVTAKASAVLAPIYERDGEAHVVLTRRAWHMRSHTGEVSFPGGRVEDGDESLWHTAIREAHEEIALPPAGVMQVSELDHLTTFMSRSFIVPYVGFLDGSPALEANPLEVDGILHVPLSELLDPDLYRQERWGLRGLDRPIHFFELVGDTVWGATAAMLYDLLTRLTVDSARR